MISAFTGIFPTSFGALALAHFAALLSPGPDFFLIIGHALRRKLRGSAFICLGIAAGNAVYIALAIMGWSGLKHSPALYRAMELAGAAFLVWMGVMLFRSSRSRKTWTVGNDRALSPFLQFCTGAGSALLNPKNAVFYLSLVTVLIGPEASLEQQTAAGVWMFLVVLLWDLGVAACISLPKVQQLLQAKIAFLEAAAGVILIGLALWLFTFG